MGDKLLGKPCRIGRVMKTEDRKHGQIEQDILHYAMKSSIIRMSSGAPTLCLAPFPSTSLPV